MTARLNRRLRLLETVTRGECPECGLAPGEPFEADEAVWHDTEDAAPGEPEWCERCGRQTTFVVEWHDLEPEVPGGGG